jgi:IMP dehydrogenase
VRNGKKYKMYRGMASFYASLGRKYREEGPQVVDSDDLNDYVARGWRHLFPTKEAW